MHLLHKELRNLIEDNDTLTITGVAEYIGSTKQELSKSLTNGGFSFRKLLRLSFLFYPQNQREVMASWCLRLNTTESIKQSFEYAAITRNIDLLSQLLEKYKDDKGLAKHISVYTVAYDYFVNNIGAKDIISRLEKVGQLKGELLILADILKCYNYYYNKKFHIMIETVTEAESAVMNLGERQLFIKECYLHRIAEIISHVALHLNDTETARHYANLIINANICAKKVSDAYYIVGMTFMHEDKRKCIEYLQARYEITRTLNEQDLELNARRDLDFAKLYTGTPLDADSDPILLRLQENKGSEFELKLIGEAMFQVGEDDLLLLWKVLAENSLEKLHNCRKAFFRDSNYYFASLAAREAKKAGETSSMIDEFIEFKIETKGDVEFEENFIRCFVPYSRSRHSSIA